GDRAPRAPRYDLILVGDLFYEQETAERALTFLERHAAVGTQVLIGDPGRTYLPRARLRKCHEYSIAVTRELEDGDIPRTAVWTLAGAPAASSAPPQAPAPRLRGLSGAPRSGLPCTTHRSREPPSALVPDPRCSESRIGGAASRRRCARRRAWCRVRAKPSRG